jgi:hypothetical protein
VNVVFCLGDTQRLLTPFKNLWYLTVVTVLVLLHWNLISGFSDLRSTCRDLLLRVISVVMALVAIVRVFAVLLICV